MISALGGWILFTIIILMTLVAFIFVVLFTLKSVQWAKDYKKGLDVKRLQIEILVLSLLASILTSARAIIYLIKGAHMGRNIHHKMTYKILHAPLIELLQRMPFGQLLNRFTFDIDIIDKRIPPLIGYVTLLLFLVLVDIAAVLIGVDNILIAIPCAVFLVIGHIIRMRYMKSKREMMRLYSISKSPISGLTESIIKGSPLIRALRREDYFSSRMEMDIDENSKSGYVSWGLDKWFQQRMAIVAWVVVLIPAYAYVIVKFLTMKP